MRRFARVLTIFAAGAAVLYGATGAQAASTVTVGADLASPVEMQGACNEPVSCGSVRLSATAPSTATISPIVGTVTTWRVEGAFATPAT